MRADYWLEEQMSSEIKFKVITLLVLLAYLKR